MKRPATWTFLDGIVAPGSSVRLCSEEETAALTAAWLAVFGANREGIPATGPKGFLWHVFSAGRYPCVEGEEARSRYRLQRAAEYVVLPHGGRAAVAADSLPQEAELADYCVFPPNLAWTIAFTHEAGMDGPYFATHARFDALNKKQSGPAPEEAGS